MTSENILQTTDVLPAAEAGRTAKKKKRFTKRAVGDAIKLTFIYIFLILIALIVVVPIVYIVLMSVNADRTLYIDTIFPTHYSFEAFERLFTETDFLLWYGNTLIVGAMNAFLCLILVFPTAYALSRLRFKGRKNYLMVFLVLQMFPGTMSMVAYYVLLNMLGLLDNYFGIVLVFACTAVPGSTFLMKGYLDTVSREIEEAAMLDGASRFQCVTRVMIPLAKPMVGLVCLFGFATPFGDYMLSRFLITDPGKYTLALGIYDTIFSSAGSTDYSLFAAAALLSSLPMTIIYMCLQKVIINGLSGATK